MGKIEHNIRSARQEDSEFNYKQNRQYAIWIHDFVKRYLNERAIEKTKRTALDNARSALGKLKKLMKKKENMSDIELTFRRAKDYFKDYSEKGALYMIRHPEKWKSDAAGDRKKGRNLSKKGVKQAKEFAEKIMEDLLLTPREARLELYTSELRRTFLLQEVIKKINKVEKLHKDVDTYKDQDSRLNLGPLIESKETHDLYSEYHKKYGKVEGTTRAFFDWRNGKGKYGDYIKEGKIENPKETEKRVKNFIRDMIVEDREEDYYVISIGIAHTWVLEGPILDYFDIEQNLETCEYYKIENGHIWFREDWKRLSALG